MIIDLTEFVDLLKGKKVRKYFINTDDIKYYEETEDEDSIYITIKYFNREDDIFEFKNKHEIIDVKSYMRKELEKSYMECIDMYAGMYKTDWDILDSSSKYDIILKIKNNIKSIAFGKIIKSCYKRYNELYLILNNDNKKRLKFQYELNSNFNEAFNNFNIEKGFDKIRAHNVRWVVTDGGRRFFPVRKTPDGEYKVFEELSNIMDNIKNIFEK